MFVEDVIGLFGGVPPPSLSLVGLAVAVMTGLADGSMVGNDVGPTGGPCEGLFFFLRC